MTILQAILLAIVQGFTEFLPVSSSAHLVIIQKLYDLAQPPVLFDILLHLGTLMAVLIYFRKDLFEMVRNWKRNLMMWKLLIIASIPAGVAGILLNSHVEKLFNSISLVGITLIITGILLIATKFVKKKTNNRKIAIIDAIMIGLFQAMAILPGISRSGSTISAGLYRGIDSKEVFKFSFLLSIPAILGAALIQIKDGYLGGVGFSLSIVSFIVAGQVGYLSLVLLRKIVISNRFYLFGIYCLLLGFICLTIFDKILN